MQCSAANVCMHCSSSPASADVAAAQAVGMAACPKAIAWLLLASATLMGILRLYARITR